MHQVKIEQYNGRKLVLLENIMIKNVEFQKETKATIKGICILFPHVVIKVHYTKKANDRYSAYESTSWYH